MSNYRVERSLKSSTKRNVADHDAFLCVRDVCVLQQPYESLPHQLRIGCRSDDYPIQDFLKLDPIEVVFREILEGKIVNYLDDATNRHDLARHREC